MEVNIILQSCFYGNWSIAIAIDCPEHCQGICTADRLNQCFLIYLIFQNK